MKYLDVLNFALKVKNISLFKIEIISYKIASW